jgi:hypothetical protein
MKSWSAISASVWRRAIRQSTSRSRAVYPNCSVPWHGHGPGAIASRGHRDSSSSELAAGASSSADIRLSSARVFVTISSSGRRIAPHLYSSAQIGQPPCETPTGYPPVPLFPWIGALISIWSEWPSMRVRGQTNCHEAWGCDRSAMGPRPQRNTRSCRIGFAFIDRKRGENADGEGKSPSPSFECNCRVDLHRDALEVLGQIVGRKPGMRVNRLGRVVAGGAAPV